MSFAKIAESRAVKKIVLFLRELARHEAQAEAGGDPWSGSHSGLLAAVALRIEEGQWRDVKLPRKKSKR